MEQIIRQTKLPSILFVLLGIVLVFISYLLAGGPDRPQYSPFCVPAILGVLMCAWTLFIIGRGFLLHKKIRKEDFLNGMGALIISPLMILVGLWMLDLHISLSFGGTVSIPQDVFDVLSILLVMMGLLIMIFAVILAFVAESKRKTIS